MATYYVTSHVVYRGVGVKQRITYGVSVTEDRATAVADQATLGIPGSPAHVYAVECPTKGEAEGIVFRWLATGRPSAMRVTEMSGARGLR